MGKHRYRRKKASLAARIKEYREKIAKEQQKATPDAGLIRHRGSDPASARAYPWA
jgi:hypothetical protein